MTIWNSTCNPCFSTFDQFLFVFHGLETVCFCYSLKLNFICYLNILFTIDYSFWEGGRHTFFRAKTNFKFILKSFSICTLPSYNNLITIFKTGLYYSVGIVYATTCVFFINVINERW